MRIALYDTHGDLLFTGKSLLSDLPPPPRGDDRESAPPSSSGVLRTQRAREDVG